MESLNRLSLWSRLLRLSSCSVAIGSMAILAACGGDSSSGADNEGKGAELLEGAEIDLIVDVFDDLPVCSDKREGATAYVKDEKTAYVCVDGDWTADGTPSSSATDAPSSSSATTEDLSSSVTQSDSEGSSTSGSKSGDDKDVSSSSGEIDSSSSAEATSNSSSPSSSSATTECLSSSSGEINSSSSAEATSNSSSPSSSSATTEGLSSSSGEVDSSSSAEATSNSSSAGNVDCSALLEGETDWNWNVPKECRLNPEITYGTMTDSRDQKVYRTVTIGTQTWMAENLNYADSIKTPSLKGKSWCYGDVAANCDVAGRLYTWAAAIDSVKLATDAENPLDCGYGKTCGLSGKVQGICPSGWHLPSESEWNTLITKVGGKDVAGTKLKNQSGWVKNGNGDDAFGFSALPAGRYQRYGNYGGGGAAFWSSTAYGSYYANYMYLNQGECAYLSYDDKDFGLSVRCLKD